jgi:hypothetical protein
MDFAFEASPYLIREIHEHLRSILVHLAVTFKFTTTVREPQSMMASLDTQQRLYQPLKGSAIRLLSIKPGFPSEAIECGFVTIANLSESPPYDALSYVWGEQLNADPIVCNGVKTTVTKQLADALQHLRRFPGWGSVIPWREDNPLLSSKNAWNGFARNRHENHDDISGDHEVLLWVDALCINQGDGDERASQVKMMGQIYERVPISAHLAGYLSYFLSSHKLCGMLVVQ